MVTNQSECHLKCKFFKTFMAILLTSICRTHVKHNLITHRFPLHQRMIVRQTEMYVISINGAEEEDKRRVEKRRREGLLDYLGYECQRTWKRGSCIKYAAVQIRLPGGRITQSHFLALFQTVNHPHAMAASLFLFWHLPLLQSDIFSWPFLCCLTSFKHPSLTSHSTCSCWESVSFRLPAAAMSPFCHSPTGPHAGKNAFKSMH